MTDAIEVFERADGKWAYRVKGENGEVMTQSEGYPNVFNANRGAQSLVHRLKDVDKNAIAAVNQSFNGEVPAQTEKPEVLEATGVEVTVQHNEVQITLVGPKGEGSRRIVLSGENLTLLKQRLIEAETAAPPKETYLLSIIERAATYTATPPSIDTLTDWVKNDRGLGGNPFDKTNLDSDVRDVVVDLFFARRIRTDNKKGLTVVEREGR